MSLISNARDRLAKIISPAAFKQVEAEISKIDPGVSGPTAPARSGGMTPNEFNRAVALAWNFHEGIAQSRERTSLPFNASDTKDTSNSWTRMQYLSVARYLWKNDGLCKGAINDMARYTVGTGLVPKSHASTEERAKSYEDYFNDWAFRADYSGKHHLGRLQYMWNVGEVRDGDLGIALVTDEAGEAKVQTIRGHRIGNFGDNADGLNDGVRTDAFDRVVSYRVSVPGGKARDIPAAAFILNYESEDPDAVRGETMLAHGICHARDKKDILGFEKVAVKKSSAIAAVLKTASGTVDPSEWDDEDDPSAEPTKLSIMQMQSGQVPVMGKDEELVFHDSSRPSPAFTGFLAFLVREIALGLGLPVEFIWDASALGGTTARFIIEKADRRFKERRKRFSDSVMNRVWGHVIGNAINRGKLEDDPKKFDLSWRGPADLSVDAGRDQSNDREDLKMGLITEEDHYGIRGLDYRVKRKQIAREADELLTTAADLAKKHGITTEFALGLLRQSTPNGFMISAQQPTPAAKPGASKIV